MDAPGHVPSVPSPKSGTGQFCCKVHRVPSTPSSHPAHKSNPLKRILTNLDASICGNLPAVQFFPEFEMTMAAPE